MGSCAPTAAPAPDEETPSPLLQIGTTTSSATERKRRPAGTPDLEAEVVSLSPRALLEPQPPRYVCETCSQVFRREHNLLFHRRRHGPPWELSKRSAAPRKKRVFVRPEPSCLRHHPSRALGDHTAIKNHFRRKHGGRRPWACDRCSRAYAVLSDYKVHVRTCGTRAAAGHTCHCGRVFTRVDSFVMHRDMCSAGRPRAGVWVAAAPSPPPQQQAPMARSPCRPSPSWSSDIVMGAVAARSPDFPAFHRFLDQGPSGTRGGGPHNLELQLMPPSCYTAAPRSPQAPISREDDDVATELRLSIGFRPSPFTGHVVGPRAQARR